MKLSQKIAAVTMTAMMAATIGLTATQNGNFLGVKANPDNYVLTLSKTTGNGVPTVIGYAKATGENIVVKTTLGNSITMHSQGFVKYTQTTFNYVLQTNTTSTNLTVDTEYYNVDAIKGITSISFDYSTKVAAEITVSSGVSADELTENKTFTFEAPSSYVNDNFTYTPTTTANYFKLHMSRAKGGTFYFRDINITYTC